MALNKDEIINVVKSVFPEVKVSEHRNQLTIIINKDVLLKVAKTLKDSDITSFDMLTDITAIDWMKKEERFELVYFLYSNKNKSRLRIKVPVSMLDLKCQTVSGIWESANWYERETFDMYGIIFENHPGLRRFYMPEDFNDPLTGEPLYPLRKDFPLMGVPDSLPLPVYPERYGKSD